MSAQRRHTVRVQPIGNVLQREALGLQLTNPPKYLGFPLEYSRFRTFLMSRTFLMFSTFRTSRMFHTFGMSDMFRTYRTFEMCGETFRDLVNHLRHRAGNGLLYGTFETFHQGCGV